MTSQILTRPRRRIRRVALAAPLAAVAAFAAPAAADAAITASYSGVSDTLVVNGDTLSNTIKIGSDATGEIRVNDGLVRVVGGPAFIGTTDKIQVDGKDGADAITFDESNSKLPASLVLGGTGNDFIAGGSSVDQVHAGDGHDTVDGRGGADLLFLDAENDTVMWTAGGGSDAVSGGLGSDHLKLIGSPVDDRLGVAAESTAVRITHGASGARPVLSGVERATLSPVGGPDAVHVGALGATPLQTVDLDLGFPAGGTTGDGRRDQISIAGAVGSADAIALESIADAPNAVGKTFRFRAGDAALDTVQVATHSGPDTVDTSRMPQSFAGVTVLGGEDGDVLTGGLAKETLHGGDGGDTIVAGGADDVVTGGSGVDTIDGGAGRDQLEGGTGVETIAGGDDQDTFLWKPGEGSDRIEGGVGLDTLRLTGTGSAERFAVARATDRVRVRRDLGAADTAPATLDAGATEALHVSAAGGADEVSIGDLRGTPLAAATLDLAVSPGQTTPDATADTVRIAGTENSDAITAAPETGRGFVTGLAAVVRISHHDRGLDRVALDLRGSADKVSAAFFPVALAVDGGDGRDDIASGGLDDVLSGGGGDDVVRWQPGQGSDRVDGGAGRDRLLVAGSNVQEAFALAALGGRLRLTRDIASVVLDVGSIEDVDVATLGGVDEAIVGDLTGAGVANVKLDLASTVDGPSGDGLADQVIVQGTQGPDEIHVSGVDGAATVAGLAARTTIRGSDQSRDTLRINALAGEDVIDAGDLATALIADGGTEDDVLVGGRADDALFGGEGDDALFGGPGNDVLDGGPGDDAEIHD